MSRAPLVSSFATLTSAFVFGTFAFMACGKTTTETAPPSADASPADARTGDSGIGPSAPSCPAKAPKSGEACAKPDLLCEYGDDFNPLCNDIFVCSSSKTWATPILYGDGNTCPSPNPILPPNPSDCAPTFDQFPAGTCSSKSVCYYDGHTCSCGDGCPNYPIRRPDCNPDAGVTENCCDTTKLAWHCYSGPAMCKTPRPRVGSACESEGERCALAPAEECGQPAMECRDSIWQMSNTSCPISSARYKRDIEYVSDVEEQRLHDDLMSVRLATYRYASGDDASHLGFIIEDMPRTSPAVLPSRDRVDLYGYVSMAVASLQQQNKEIAALKQKVERLERENANLKTRRSPAR